MIRNALLAAVAVLGLSVGSAHALDGSAVGSAGAAAGALSVNQTPNMFPFLGFSVNSDGVWSNSSTTGAVTSTETLTGAEVNITETTFGAVKIYQGDVLGFGVFTTDASTWGTSTSVGIGYSEAGIAGRADVLGNASTQVELGPLSAGAGAEVVGTGQYVAQANGLGLVSVSDTWGTTTIGGAGLAGANLNGNLTTFIGIPVSVGVGGNTLSVGTFSGTALSGASNYSFGPGLATSQASSLAAVAGSVSTN